MSEIDLQRQIDELRRTVRGAESRGGVMTALRSYTCSWTGSTGNPALNDGTLSAYYATRGKLCLVVINLTMGAGTTYGSGFWAFSIPFTASALVCLGAALATDSSASNARYPLIVASPVSGNAVQFFAPTTAATTTVTLTPTVPFTWAANDTLRIQIEYETA